MYILAMILDSAPQLPPPWFKIYGEWVVIHKLENDWCFNGTRIKNKKQKRK